MTEAPAPSIFNKKTAQEHLSYFNSNKYIIFLFNNYNTSFEY